MTDYPSPPSEPEAPNDRAETETRIAEMAEHSRDAVMEHVSEIMFASHDSPDPDCIECQAGVRTGAWAAYGVDDPFTEEAEDA